YLDADQRRAALALSRALRAVEQAWRSGEADTKALQRRGMEVLTAPGVRPGYLELVDEQLRPVARADARTVVAIAAHVGATRLIDNHGVGRHNRHLVADAHIPGRADGIAGTEGGDHLVRGEPVGANPIGIEVHHDGALVAAKGRRRGDAGQADEQRPDPDVGRVLNGADALGLAAQHQEADGDAAAIEA